MSFMGGLEATEHIRKYEKEHDLAHVPIVALTAHASEYLAKFGGALTDWHGSDRRQGALSSRGHGRPHHQ